MSLPVRTVSRLLAPLFVVYAANLIVTQATAPGGAFAGGVVVGVTAFLIIVGEEMRNVITRFTSWIEAGRAAGFGLVILASLLGVIFGGTFLSTGSWIGFDSSLLNLFGFAAGIVVGCEIVLAFDQMMRIEVTK